MIDVKMNILYILVFYLQGFKSWFASKIYGHHIVV